MDWSKANSLHGHSFSHEIYRDNSRVAEVAEIDTYDCISRPDFSFSDMFPVDIVLANNRSNVGVKRRKASLGRPITSVINKEFLEEYYINKGMSIQEIADAYDLKHTTIRRYMVRFGIPKRKAVRLKKDRGQR